MNLMIFSEFDGVDEEAFKQILSKMKKTLPHPSPEEIKVFKEWQDSWAGRAFRCKETGEQFIIPNNVKQRNFFSFGNCFVDVGRVGSYCRFGGPIEEVSSE